MKTNVILCIILFCLYPHIVFAQNSENSPVPSIGQAIGLVKSSTGKPVVDIAVHLIAISGDSYSIVKTTRTNSKGVWFMNQVPQGKYVAWVGKIPDTLGVVIEKEVTAGKINQFAVHIMNNNK